MQSRSSVIRCLLEWFTYAPYPLLLLFLPVATHASAFFTPFSLALSPRLCIMYYVWRIVVTFSALFTLIIHHVLRLVSLCLSRNPKQTSGYVCVLCAGYVTLMSGLCFCHMGHGVVMGILISGSRRQLYPGSSLCNTRSFPGQPDLQMLWLWYAN